MSDPVNLFRIAGLCAWTVPFIALAPTVARTLRKVPRALDPIFALFWFVSLITMAFISRHFVAPDDTVVWCILYSISVVCALGVFGVWRSYDRI